MYTNTCIFYIGLTDIYENLLSFCTENGFKVKESNEKFYFIRAQKSSFLFWKNMRLDLEILAIEKTQVQVTAKIYKFKIRQHTQEKKYIKAIETYCNFSAEQRSKAN